MKAAEIFTRCHAKLFPFLDVEPSESALLTLFAWLVFREQGPPFFSWALHPSMKPFQYPSLF
jgi:hypothetical protein